MIDSNDQCVHTQTSIIRVKLTYTLYYQATATYVTVFSEIQQPAYDCPTTFAVQVEGKAHIYQQQRACACVTVYSLTTAWLSADMSFSSRMSLTTSNN